MDEPLKCTVRQREYYDLPNKRGGVSNKNIGLQEQQCILSWLKMFYVDQQSGVRWLLQSLHCNVASLRGFTKWKVEKKIHCRVLQGWGPETFGSEVFWKMFPQAHHCREQCPGWSKSVPPSCWAPRGRTPDSRCATGKDGRNTTSSCHVVLRRRQDCYVGQSRPWVVTALRCKISSGSWADLAPRCSRFRPHILPLLQSFPTVMLWLGARQIMEGTALRSKLSLGMCSRSRPIGVHLLRSWLMDLLLLGAIHRMVVTALPSRINFGMRSQCCHHWQRLHFNEVQRNAL